MLLIVNAILTVSREMSIIKNKVFKNFSVLAGTNITIQILSILSSVRLARQLHPDGYGLFNLVFVQVSIFSIIALYGLRTVIIRHIARNKNDIRKVLTVSNQIRVVSTFLALLIALAYNLLNKHQSVTKVFIVALLLLIIFTVIWDSIESIFFGFEKMEISGYINLLFTFVWVTEIYLIPNNYFNGNVLFLAYVANQGAKTLIYYFWLNRKILSQSRPYLFSGFNDHKDLIKQSNFYFLLSIIQVATSQAPILLLQFNSTIDQIGLFNLGNRILSPLQMMLNMLLTALFPMLARLAVENKKLFAQRITSLINIIVLTGIWGALCFALFSYDVVHLLYGAAYATSANVILTQCWFTVMFFISCTIGVVLNSLDKQKLLTQMTMIYAVVSAPIFYFGTKHGAIGLAWAFVIAAFVNMTYQWVIFRKLLQNQISVLYSFFIFSVIGTLSLLTYFYKIEYSFIIRLIIAIVLTISLLVYIFKVEYQKIKVS